jgi:hypothetical protein
MNSSSHYWRTDLKRRAKILRDKEEQARWGEDALTILEQTVVLGFYAIRKLEVYGWLAPHKLKGKVKLKEFPSLSAAPSHPGQEELSHSYAMDKGKRVERDMAFLEHQLSHTVFFETKLNTENHPVGFYFTSERQKSKALYCVQIQDVINIFEDVGHLQI